MSLTTGNNQNQQGGAGQSGGTNGNGAGAGTQGQSNQITQLSQDPAAAGGGTAGIGGNGTGRVPPVVQVQAQGQQPGVGAGTQVQVQVPGVVPPGAQVQVQGQQQGVPQGTQGHVQGQQQGVGAGAQGLVQAPPGVPPGVQAHAQGQQQGVGAGVQVLVQGQQPANPHQLTLWNGNWPGAKGKIADYMSSKAGTPAAQKETAEKVFNFLRNPNALLATIGSDTQPIAYLIHVAGTTNVRVLYGLSPIIMNSFLPDKPRLFRALIRDLESDHDRIPGLMCLPASIVDMHSVEVPTDAYYFTKLADASIDKSAPWFKTGAAQDAMKANEKENSAMMKIVPVPLYTVLDGWERDLSAAEVAERIKFILDVDAKDYLKHALHFCKACATSYGASAREKIPTIAAGAFASIPSEEDKEWAVGRTVQLCPTLTIQAPVRTLGDNTSATAMVASAGFNAQLFDIMKEMVANKNNNGGPASGSRGTDSAEEELLKNTWHGKLSMSKSGVAHLLRFCGLQAGEEQLIPKLWFRLGEKGMETVDKQREIRSVLENNKTYVDVRAPVTASLLKIIAKRDWCEGEMTLTLANVMKGLSIFAMQPLSAEEISTYDAYDECLDRASSTTVQDIAGGSGKRKHHVPSTCYGLETYLKSLVNILDAITDSGSPLADDLKFILLQLQQWESSAKAAITQRQIGTIMWVILKESRRFYNGIETEKCASFNAMCNHLKGQMPFSIVGLPEGLLDVKNPTTTETKAQKKRRLAEEAKAVIDLTEQPSPPQKQRIKQERNAIIVDKLGSTIAKASRHGIGLSQLCNLCDEKLWDMFPEYCGYTTMYGKCNKKDCSFKHETVPDAVAKKVVAKLKKVIDDPTLITGKSPAS